MLFNVQIEIDWISDDHTLDSQLQDRIITSLSDSIIKQFSADCGKQIAKTAESYVKAKTEMIINSVLENPITIQDGFYHKKEYASIFDMVEQEFTDLYKGKVGENGKCKEDPLLSNIKRHVKSEADRLINQVENSLKKVAKQAAQDEFKENELIKAIDYRLSDTQKKKS